MLARVTLSSTFSSQRASSKPVSHKTNLGKGTTKLIGSLRFSSLMPNPPIEFKTTAEAPKDFQSTTDIFKNKKVQGVAERIEEFKEKGIEDIYAVSVNDAGVLTAFAKTITVNSKITFLADFDAALTKLLGMEIDLTTAKLGKRSKRYAMLIENGKIEKQFVEAKPGDLKVSNAGEVLKHL